MTALCKYDTEPHVYKIQYKWIQKCLFQSNGTTSELSAQKCHFADSVRNRFQVSAKNTTSKHYIHTETQLQPANQCPEKFKQFTFCYKLSVLVIVIDTSYAWLQPVNLT